MSKKYFIIILLFIFDSSLAENLNYKGLEKLSKNNTFMDNKGKSYSIDSIDNKKDVLLIIHNHGSDNDLVKDKCQRSPKFGYTWNGAVVPAILDLHNKKINNLTIKIYRVCSGVKGISLKTMQKYRNQIKKNGKIELADEYKNIKRQKIILSEVKKFKSMGFENIVLAGYSAGGWASLNLQSRFPDIVKGAIAINPAFAGKKKQWQKKYPEWGAFRELQIDIFEKSESLDAIIFVHDKDKFEDSETLSFFSKFKGTNFINYSDLKASSCNWADVNKKMPSHEGHNIPQSSCFTKYINEKNYFINFLERIF